MKVQQNSYNNMQVVQDNKKNLHVVQSEPNFKGAGTLVMDLIGSSMQGIQNAGFLATFLVQDVVGMTVPRTLTAYKRDKEVTGKSNKQEGREVLIREGMTGPIMMAIAPVMFILAAKFGRSTGVNSQLIKRFGNKLKTMSEHTKMDKNLLKDKNKFKNEFYRANVEEMLNNSLGKENVKQADIDYILEQLANHDNIPSNAKLKKFRGKKKYKDECLANINKRINEIRYTTSSKLGSLDKVMVGSGDAAKEFNTKEAMSSMIKYSDDAYKFSKDLEVLDLAQAEKLRNVSLVKRLITNISTVAATLGILSVIPRIYAKNDISPGAQTAMIMREQENQKYASQNAENDENNENVSFKGKGNKSKSLFERFGKFLNDKFSDKAASKWEYDGHNFTPALMTGLSVGGLIFPRGIRAINRAQKDENGKKDLTELYEVLIRDLTSSLSVIFAVPILTRLFVTGFERSNGFVLMERDHSKSRFKTLMDSLNPASKSHVYTNNELQNLYHGVDTYDKMMNFCKYIDNNGGDLQKIISKSDSATEIFNESTLKLSDIEKLSKQEKNKKIISKLEELGNKAGNDKSVLDKSIEKMMKGKSGEVKLNKIFRSARDLNSFPAFISTLVLSPIILGVLIPKLTYANTRRIHRKRDEESRNSQKLNSTV